MSADFLDAAKRNVVQTCKGMKPDNAGTICQPYLQGLQTARDRCIYCKISGADE